MPDLDWGNVYDDAANDPTLDRPCDTPNCDGSCPLIHDYEPDELDQQRLDAIELRQQMETRRLQDDDREYFMDKDEE